MRYFSVRFFLLSLLILPVSCNNSSPEVREAAVSAGISQETAGELAKMDLDTLERLSMIRVKKAGVDDASILKMVQALHNQKLKFTIGQEVELLKGLGIGNVLLTQLVELGAVPRMSADIRALKGAGVSDIAILEIANLRFKQDKTLLSGNEYAQIKTNGLSDAGLLTFIRGGGTAQQLQTVSYELALGTPEQGALKKAGF